ncbi:MAG: sigma-70 family RNA polymerase sigma factor [Pontiellaceae bacterium]|nr:sigma-70 family RNA polymerase sigma factor [Pontiellaceae bacterium]MBN2783677.1 sigma-70 family RNA polymerase sigma factor [Pontiellaceae bacterium]
MKTGRYDVVFMRMLMIFAEESKGLGKDVFVGFHVASVCRRFIFRAIVNDFTTVLHSAINGDSSQSGELMPLIYDELRRLAQLHMSRERGDHTLQATALVHEAWLRLVAEGDRTWQNRAYFFSAAASEMRRILVDHARSKGARKRGGGQKRLCVDDVELASFEKEEAILLVDEALERLEQINPDRAKVVVLKFFGGMTSGEAAETMGISESTVNRHWACARVWLHDAIQSQHP